MMVDAFRKVLLLALIASAGCSRAKPSSRPADFESLPLWVLDSVPTVSVGAPIGDETQELYYVRDASFLSDGTVVVADQGRSELRFYDSTGRFLRSFGRRGEGPREFKALVDVITTGDTVVAYDAELRRFTWLSSDGELIGSAQAPLALRVQFPVILAQGDSVWFFLGPRTPSRIGLVRDTLQLVVLTRSGRLDSLISRPGEEHWAEPSQLGGITWQTDFTHRRLLAAGHGASIYLALTDSPIIRKHDLAGHLLGEVRWTARLVPFNRTAMAEYLTYFKDYPDHGAQVKRRLSQRREPPTLPVLSRLLVDDDGHVWARPYTLLPTTAIEWLVFDSTLKPLARARTQPGLMHIGTALALTRWLDQEEVNYVRIHRIRGYPTTIDH